MINISSYMKYFTDLEDLILMLEEYTDLTHSEAVETSSNMHSDGWATIDSGKHHVTCRRSKLHEPVDILDIYKHYSEKNYVKHMITSRNPITHEMETRFEKRRIKEIYPIVYTKKEGSK